MQSKGNILMANFDFESGRRYMAEGDIVEGIRCLLASLDLDPDYVPAYIELFKAYKQAWVESSDPDVLDQMRKVAVAGLKREADAAQREFLQKGLDLTEEWIIELDYSGEA